MQLMTLIKPLLKRRFTAHGMWIENVILDSLGNRYYQGDRAVWEAHRRHGYYMWSIGKDAEDIAFYHGLPMTVIKWWIEIWQMYFNAWGGLYDNLQ